MTEKSDVEVIRRIYPPFSDGAFLEIRPCPDSPMDTIELNSAGKENEEYFGKIRIVMSQDFAKAIAAALLASVRDLPESE